MKAARGTVASPKTMDSSRTHNGLAPQVMTPAFNSM